MTGFRAPALAREAGFGVDARGRITVDETLRSTSHPQVYAVGDAAALPTPDGRTSRTVTRATVQRVRRPGPPLPFACFGPSGG